MDFKTNFVDISKKIKNIDDEYLEKRNMLYKKYLELKKEMDNSSSIFQTKESLDKAQKLHTEYKKLLEKLNESNIIIIDEIIDDNAELIMELNQNINNLQILLASALAENVNLKDQVNDLNILITDKLAEINILKNDLVVEQNKNRDLKKELIDKAGEGAILENKVKESDAKIAEIKAKMKNVWDIIVDILNVKIPQIVNVLKGQGIDANNPISLQVQVLFNEINDNVLVKQLAAEHGSVIVPLDLVKGHISNPTDVLIVNTQLFNDLKKVKPENVLSDIKPTDFQYWTLQFLNQCRRGVRSNDTSPLTLITYQQLNNYEFIPKLANGSVRSTDTLANLLFFNNYLDEFSDDIFMNNDSLFLLNCKNTIDVLRGFYESRLTINDKDVSKLIPKPEFKSVPYNFYMGTANNYVVGQYESGLYFEWEEINNRFRLIYLLLIFSYKIKTKLKSLGALTPDRERAFTIKLIFNDKNTLDRKNILCEDYFQIINGLNSLYTERLPYIDDILQNWKATPGDISKIKGNYVSSKDDIIINELIYDRDSTSRRYNYNILTKSFTVINDYNAVTKEVRDICQDDSLSVTYIIDNLNLEVKKTGFFEKIKFMTLYRSFTQDSKFAYMLITELPHLLNFSDLLNLNPTEMMNIGSKNDYDIFVDSLSYTLQNNISFLKNTTPKIKEIITFIENMKNNKLVMTPVMDIINAYKSSTINTEQFIHEIVNNIKYYNINDVFEICNADFGNEFYNPLMMDFTKQIFPFISIDRNITFTSKNPAIHMDVLFDKFKDKIPADQAEAKVISEQLYSIVHKVLYIMEHNPLFDYEYFAHHEEYSAGTDHTDFSSYYRNFIYNSIGITKSRSIKQVLYGLICSDKSVNEFNMELKKECKDAFDIPFTTYKKRPTKSQLFFKFLRFLNLSAGDKAPKDYDDNSNAVELISEIIFNSMGNFYVKDNIVKVCDIITNHIYNNFKLIDYINTDKTVFDQDKYTPGETTVKSKDLTATICIKLLVGIIIGTRQGFLTDTLTFKSELLNDPANRRLIAEKISIVGGAAMSSTFFTSFLNDTNFPKVVGKITNDFSRFDLLLEVIQICTDQNKYYFEIYGPYIDEKFIKNNLKKKKSFDDLRNALLSNKNIDADTKIKTEDEYNNYYITLFNVEKTKTPLYVQIETERDAKIADVYTQITAFHLDNYVNGDKGDGSGDIKADINDIKLVKDNEIDVKIDTYYPPALQAIHDEYIRIGRDSTNHNLDIENILFNVHNDRNLNINNLIFNYTNINYTQYINKLKNITNDEKLVLKINNYETVLQATINQENYSNFNADNDHKILFYSIHSDDVDSQRVYRNLKTIFTGPTPDKALSYLKKKQVLGVFLIPAVLFMHMNDGTYKIYTLVYEAFCGFAKCVYYYKSVLADGNGQHQYILLGLFKFNLASSNPDIVNVNAKTRAARGLPVKKDDGDANANVDADGNVIILTVKQRLIKEKNKDATGDPILPQNLPAVNSLTSVNQFDYVYESFISKYINDKLADDIIHEPDPSKHINDIIIDVSNYKFEEKRIGYNDGYAVLMDIGFVDLLQWVKMTGFFPNNKLSSHSFYKILLNLIYITIILYNRGLLYMDLKLQNMLFFYENNSMKIKFIDLGSIIPSNLIIGEQFFPVMTIQCSRNNAAFVFDNPNLINFHTINKIDKKRIDYEWQQMYFDLNHVHVKNTFKLFNNAFDDSFSEIDILNKYCYIDKLKPVVLTDLSDKEIILYAGRISFMANIMYFIMSAILLFVYGENFEGDLNGDEEEEESIKKPSILLIINRLENMYSAKKVGNNLDYSKMKNLQNIFMNYVNHVNIQNKLKDQALFDYLHEVEYQFYDMIRSLSNIFDNTQAFDNPDQSINSQIILHINNMQDYIKNKIEFALVNMYFISEPYKDFLWNVSEYDGQHHIFNRIWFTDSVSETTPKIQRIIHDEYEANGKLDFITKNEVIKLLMEIFVPDNQSILESIEKSHINNGFKIYGIPPELVFRFNLALLSNIVFLNGQEYNDIIIKNKIKIQGRIIFYNDMANVNDLDAKRLLFFRNILKPAGDHLTLNDIDDTSKLIATELIEQHKNGGQLIMWLGILKKIVNLDDNLINTLAELKLRLFTVINNNAEVRNVKSGTYIFVLINTNMISLDDIKNFIYNEIQDDDENNNIFKRVKNLNKKIAFVLYNNVDTDICNLFKNQIIEKVVTDNIIVGGNEIIHKKNKNKKINKVGGNSYPLITGFTFFGYHIIILILILIICYKLLYTFINTPCNNKSIPIHKPYRNY